MPVGKQEQSHTNDLQYVPPPGAEQLSASRAVRHLTGDDEQLLSTMLNVGAATTVPPSSGATATAPVPKERRTQRSEPEPDQPIAVPQLSRASGLSWGQQLFVEVVTFLLLGVGVYALDLAFTILGLTQGIFPATWNGYIGAATFHVFMSLGQRYFVFQRGGIRLLGALLLGVNTVTNLYGIIPVVDHWLGPDVLGSLPRNPAYWMPILSSRIWASILESLFGHAESQVSIPTWWITAIVLSLLCGTVAWWAEILLIWFYRRVRYVALRRPT